MEQPNSNTTITAKNDMYKTKTAMCSIILLVYITSAGTEIVLINPQAGATINITAHPQQTIQQTITVKNVGKETIQGITPTTTLSNTEFSSPNFGLDPEQNKTFTAQIQAEENQQGTITIQEQSFNVKINIVENKTVIDLLLERLQENTSLLWLATFVIVLAVILIKLRGIN